MEVSSRVHFGPKTVDPKSLGKKVMKDQNGNLIDHNHRDKDFLADQGLYERFLFSFITIYQLGHNFTLMSS